MKFISFCVLAAAAFSFSVLAENPGIDFFSVECTGACEETDETLSAEFTVNSDDPEFSLPNTSSQKVKNLRVSKGVTAVQLVTGNFSSVKTPIKPEYTADSRFIDTTNKLLIEHAKPLLTLPDKEKKYYGETTVKSLITNIQTGTPLLTSNQILAVQSGDCVQASVLLTALFRTARIPARSVMGLVYANKYEGKMNRFVYHMWTEVFIQGRWFIADATQPSRETRQAKYIALSYHSLKSESPLDYAAALSHISNLRIKRTK
jgi:Transglutaminase-like superfamily